MQYAKAKLKVHRTNENYWPIGMTGKGKVQNEYKRKNDIKYKRKRGSC